VFEIPLADLENELNTLRALGLEVESAEHAWVHWRSLYVTDPEGNQVELVLLRRECLGHPATGELSARFSRRLHLVGEQGTPL